MKVRLFASAMAAAMGLASASQAAIVTFNIKWSGDTFGNSAIATGFITVDTAVLPGGFGFAPRDLPDAAVLDLGVDVSGAFGGNGHFGLADFSQVIFWSPTTLDLGAELIGQAVGKGCPYGTSVGLCGLAKSGNFGFVRADASQDAPTAWEYFTMLTSGGDEMLVTSIAPASGVPEPATWALMIGGFGLAGAALRRRTLAAA